MTNLTQRETSRARSGSRGRTPSPVAARPRRGRLHTSTAAERGTHRRAASVMRQAAANGRFLTGDRWDVTTEAGALAAAWGLSPTSRSW